MLQMQSSILLLPNHVALEPEYSLHFDGTVNCHAGDQHSNQVVIDWQHRTSALQESQGLCVGKVWLTVLWFLHGTTLFSLTSFLDKLYTTSAVKILYDHHDISLHSFLVWKTRYYVLVNSVPVSWHPTSWHQQWICMSKIWHCLSFSSCFTVPYWYMPGLPIRRIELFCLKALTGMGSHLHHEYRNSVVKLMG